MSKIISKSATQFKNEVMELFVKHLNTIYKSCEKLKERGLDGEADDMEASAFGVEELMAKINNLNPYQYEDGKQLYVYEEGSEW